MVAPLRAGDLKHKLEIRRATKVSDGSGGWTETWPVIATLMAKVEGFAPVRDNERLVGEGPTKGVNYRFRIRFRADILTSDQVRYAGMDLNITAAFDPDGNRQQTWLTATDASAKVTE